MTDKFLLCVGSILLLIMISMSLGVYLGYGTPYMSMWVFVCIVSVNSIIGCLAIYFGIKHKTQLQSLESGSGKQ